MVDDTKTVRTQIIPVWLTRQNYKHAHEATHNAALLWNDLVSHVRAEWKVGNNPWKASIEKVADQSDYPLHSHTKQAIAHDLSDAIQTSRTLRKNKTQPNVRAPYKTKQYRPLVFTKNFGWKVTPEGKLALSFGQTKKQPNPHPKKITRGKNKGKLVDKIRGKRREPIVLPLPTIIDPLSQQLVPYTLFGVGRTFGWLDVVHRATTSSLHVDAFAHPATSPVNAVTNRAPRNQPAVSYLRRTGPYTLWGEILLCWNIHAREWSLHISYTTHNMNAIPQAVPDDDGNYPPDTIIIAIDEGIINPFTLVYKDEETNTVDALVISGRQTRSNKRYRNKTVASIQKAKTKCKNGSRKHKKLVRKDKKTKAKTDRQNHNADHHVSKKGERWIRAKATNPQTGEVSPVRLVVGDVRGVEKNTRKHQRANKSTRQQLSQWSRGTQETFLAYKTGLMLEHVSEHYTSQTCPKCGTRKKVSGRVYECKNPECGLIIHRDVVGGVNIRSRSVNGGERVSSNTPILPSIDENTIVSVTYQRTQHFWDESQSVLHSYYQDVLGRSGSSKMSVVKSAVVAPNRAATSSLRETNTSSVAGYHQKVQPTTRRESRGVENIIFDTVTLPGLPQKSSPQ